MTDRRKKQTRKMANQGKSLKVQIAAYATEDEAKAISEHCEKQGIKVSPFLIGAALEKIAQQPSTNVSGTV